MFLTNINCPTIHFLSGGVIIQAAPKDNSGAFLLYFDVMLAVAFHSFTL